MSITIDKAHERLREVVAKRTAELQQRVQNYADGAIHAKQVIDGGTVDFLTTGVAFESFAFKAAFDYLDLGPAQAKLYFHDLAKEYGRPFIHAIELHPTERWHESKVFTQLTIPKTPRLNSLAATLNLVKQDKVIWEAPVTAAHSERLWRFNFYGPEGNAIFNQFRKTCATDPVRRVILKLNSLPRG